MCKSSIRIAFSDVFGEQTEKDMDNDVNVKFNIYIHNIYIKLTYLVLLVQKYIYHSTILPRSSKANVNNHFFDSGRYKKTIP
jgi:hypothetical protein